MNEIYFDNAATTRPYEKIVAQLASDMLQHYANPSSLHQFASEGKKMIEQAEKDVLNVLNLNDHRVIFTSGATESTNLAIKGIAEKTQDIKNIHMITSMIEHPCVYEVFKHYETLGAKITWIPVNKVGLINSDILVSSINKNTKLVSLIWVNNEFGSVQNVSELAKKIKYANPNTIIHIDAVQGFGKLTDDFTDIDLISLSGHKFHAPKGIGALIAKKRILLEPQMLGGGQQHGLRSGTLNAPLIAALGNTCKILNHNDFSESVVPLREYLVKSITDHFGEDVFNVIPKGYYSAPHIVNISFEGLKGEVILHMLEEYGIYISNASACSSNKKDRSTALAALGYNKKRIDGTIRISLSDENTMQQIDELLDKLTIIVKRLYRLIRK